MSTSAGLMPAHYVVYPSSVGAHVVSRPTLADDELAMRQPTSAHTGQYATVCSGIQVQMSAETLTAQSLLLGRCPTSPQSSSHSSVHEWLQATGTHAPPASPVESVSSSSSELRQVLAPRTEAPVVVPPSVRSSRVSRMTRTSRRSVASCLAMEIFRFAREMSGQTAQLVGQMQAQAQAHQDQILAQADVQRQEAKQREEAQRAEVQAQRAEAQAQRAEAKQREEMLIQMKVATEQALRKEKADADEATRKREQLYMEHELKRQKVMVEANTTLQQERVKADLHGEVAHMEALKRREAEFQQLQEKERESARDAQLKLRELAAQELKERVHLERELVKQQQQNLLLRKQREVDRLEAQVDRQLLQQAQDSLAKPASKAKLAPVRKEMATLSPETVELIEPDTPPSSQNRPKLTRRMLPVDVGVQACPATVSESLALNVGLTSQSQGLGAPSGIPLPTSVGPLVLPKGPELVPVRQPEVSLDVGQAVYTAGTRPVGPQVSSMGHLSTSHLPVGMAIQPAQAHQSLAPPLVPTSVLGSMSSTPVVPTCVMSTSSTNVATAMTSTSVGADTRPTYVSLGVPLTSAPHLVNTKAVPCVVTTASAPPPLPPVSQDPGTGGPIPSSGTVSFVAPPAPTVIIRQPEPVRPYTGQSSYKAYKEYFEKVCLCNEWKSPTECARHLLVAMDGAATDAVRG